MVYLLSDLFFFIIISGHKTKLGEFIMDIVEKYKEYRKIQVGLHNKILEKCVSKKDFKESTKRLGIYKNNVMVLESVYEKDVIFDYNTYENIKNGKNSVSAFIELGEETTPQEAELLAAMQEATTSLYEVIECQKENGIILLKDLMGDSDVIFKVIDIGLSETLNENFLLFTRLVHLDDFSMTTGLCFIFSINHKQYLLKRSRRLMKKINSGDSSLDRFIAFFHLNRSDGEPMKFNEIK